MVDKLEAGERARRDAMRHHEQMLDAEKLCVPCKLCGGAAKISDAGTGAGYYISCSNSTTWRDSTGCLINERRLGGWAYNVMDWWNRLHDATPANDEQVERAKEVAHRIVCEFRPAGWPAKEDEIARLLMLTFPTPTEDARSRVKVLEEALAMIGSMNAPAAEPTAVAMRKIARTALGNKETDRHG